MQTHQLNSALHENLADRITGSAHSLRENDVTASLSHLAQRRSEVEATPQGAVVAQTGKFTGRSPSDKFIVRDAKTTNTVWWDNASAMTTDQFDVLMQDMLTAYEGRDVFRQQLLAGADRQFQFEVDVFTPNAWHALFIRHLLIRPTASELATFKSNVTLVHLPDFEADPARHGTKSSTCIALDFTRNVILICGTQYAGEMKKSVFSLFNFHAPDADILPMHCSANLGEAGDTTLFFGLSGTGKTTLSTSSDRALIGDDEHGWGAQSVFNLEGGCYAKAINLSAKNEPEIFGAAMTLHSVMENVVLDAHGAPDFDDTSRTENTRIAYPLTSIENRVESSVGPEPKNIVLLTADAFGVLPPLAKLSAEQAIYYFLSGYTAKVAGTERGVTEPQATFSACFGAPFMARHPRDYGELLGKRLAAGEAKCWLLNTGWTGGGYGVGSRIKLPDTRRMLEAALSGDLDHTDFRLDENFQLLVPTQVDGVDSRLLDPKSTWANAAQYQSVAEKLLKLFEQNMQNLSIDSGELTAQHNQKASAA